MPHTVEDALPDLGEVGIRDGVVGLPAEPRGEDADGTVARGLVAGGEALRDVGAGEGSVHGGRRATNPRSGERLKDPRPLIETLGRPEKEAAR